MDGSILVVEHAGPSVTIQDGGRPGRMRLGVPRSGPMDPIAHAVANLVLDRPMTSTAIEVSLGGLTVRCRQAPVTVAICGGSFVVQRDGDRCSPWSVVTLRPEERLVISAGRWGSWCTLAVAGELVAPRWMGSTATHVRAGVGGGPLRAGDELVVDDPVADLLRDGPVLIPERARPRHELRVVLGPQDEWFTESAVEVFRSEPFVFTTASDRMGTRLDGPRLELVDALGIASAPVVRGSVQVNGDGVATLLHADHQTTGGYPRIATVVASDAERASQLRAGDTVRFRPVDAHEAVIAARADAAVVSRLVRTLAERPGVRSRQLLGENLIGGIIDAAGGSDEEASEPNER